MKKILLSLMLLCTGSLGAWASYYLNANHTWNYGGDALAEKVMTINVDNPGDLANAVKAINEDTNGTYAGIKHVWVKHTSGTIALSDEDITALGQLNFETIDLQDLNPTSAFTFSNNSVKNLILPDGWTKAEVNACATKMVNLGSAYSIGTYEGGTSITAYVKQGNTLKDALIRSYYESQPNMKLNNKSGLPNNQDRLNNIKSVTISGYPVAKDFSGSHMDGQVFDENGHFVFDQEADETSSVKDMGVNGTKRKLVGTDTSDGALHGVQSLIKLDLEDAIIEDAHCSDLSFSWTNACHTSIKYITLPTCKELKTIPADCFQFDGAPFCEICIPSNIEIIRTRAFNTMSHIWTTAADGDVENTCYDNGITDKDAKTVTDESGNPITGYTNYEFGENYAGTFTFSSNLKLIESHAFTETRPHVSDVYVLATSAPECHVDAFGHGFYVGYSGYGVAPGTKGIVERGSFKNSGGFWLTMLHYPRECGTPDIQRYTDPTREYSIAMGMTDGKGAQIYFPLYGEFLRAYLQATTGYTWNAWKADRNSYGDMTNNPTYETNQGWSAELQKTLNDAYDGTDNKTAFYDVTLGGNVKPSGLTDYYDVVWEGQKLYPAIESVGTGEKISVPIRDENGNLVFGDETCEEGDYVKVTTKEWVEDENGTYKQIATPKSYQSTNVPVDGVETYYSDQNGTTVEPIVKDGYFYQDGTEPDYQQVDKNNDKVGDKDQYYTKNSSNEYVQSNLKLADNKFFIKTGNKTSKKVNTWTIVQDVLKYYSLNGSSYQEATPNLKSDNGDVYYLNENGEYIQSSTFENGQGKWYVKIGEEFKLANAQYPIISLQAEYYYDGEEEDEYLAATEYEKGTTYYNNNHEEVTPSSWWNDIKQEDYYYLAGEKPKYVSANGEAYDASKTYYVSDYNGGYNTASSVEFKQNYYYATDYDYTYEEYNAETDDNVTRYSQQDVVSYRAWTEADGSVDRYCPVTQEVEVMNVTKANDYRGWHQFVLTGYAANTTNEMTSYRSYMTDNDWWTICLPYDLTKKELMFFYGNETENKKPFLSQLINVVRDMKDLTITLNFSKNLYDYKASLDSNGNWVISDEETSDNDVVLHAGVPYLIRPEMPANGYQFDIYGTANANEKLSANRNVATETTYSGLYKKLTDAYAMEGDKQLELQSKGIVTVPALVANANDADAKATENVSGTTVNFNGVDYPVSVDWDYTFVGGFFKSFIPANSYYLGWKNKAAFFLAEAETESVYSEMKWNNNTAVICPNMLSSSPAVTRSYNLGKGSHNGEVSKASGTGSDLIPAQWKITSLVLDDLATKSASSANGFGMGIGGVMSADGIKDVIDASRTFIQVDGKVYTLDGKMVGDTINGLRGGVYIQNGKKIMVK